jgi:hypothetical protein
MKAGYFYALICFESEAIGEKQFYTDEQSNYLLTDNS